MSEPAEKRSPQVEEPQAAAYDPAVAGVHAAQQLKQSGFERQQADAVVVAVRELAGDLATKSELKTEIAGLESRLMSEIAGLESRLRAEIASLDGRLSGKIAAVEGRLNGEIKTMATKEDLAQMQIQQAKDAFRHTLWTVGIIVGTLLAGMGVATAILIAVMMRLLAA